MLEDIPAIPRQGAVFRLANPGNASEAILEMGLDAEGISEMLSLLRERRLAGDPEDLLDGPFADKPFYKPQRTRFSDGSVRVFYSALEAETAEYEIEYWHMKPLVDGQDAPLRVYYHLFQCNFAGEVKDLRPLVGKWPFLIADNGYDQCNELGAEAAKTDLGGLLSQSARRPKGTTSPVFLRGCLSGPVFLDYRIFDYDSGTKKISVLSP